ncbi:unnamed protein product [Arctia plantaginis]|uniref:Transcription factor IIIC 90kDa subunit N-terminal domain-containing protein n=1 Tax=Arctia plantaginis TaxID=874455 RepID=A0A8S0YSA4_ARCPL|nr:unnamed protein product [Arctia plantaginis]
MGQDTFYELTKRSIPVTKNTGTGLSCRDSVITVRTDKGMNFLDFSYDLHCHYKDLDLYEFSIPSPKNSPAMSLCKSKFLNNEMNNYDYTEMLVDSSFWPHNNTLTEEMTHIIKSAWSPPNFIENKSVLSILNNIGGVEMFVQQQYQFKTVLDLSTYCKESLDHNPSPKTFEELKTSVYLVETCSICWAPKLNTDRSCYFVTAQKDGCILFWQIFNTEPPILKEKVKTCLSVIKNMLWIPRTETTFWLICANILGQVNVFVMQTVNGDISFLHPHLLWEYKDRMVASHLQYINHKDGLILFYGKHRHLIVQLVDANFRVITEHMENVNDYRITNIKRAIDGYYLSTVNVKIYKLDISLLGQTLNVELSPVDLKESYSTYELYSLCFSETGTLCMLGMVDRRHLCRKEPLKVEVIFLSTDAKLNSIMTLLLNNPTEQLTHYWDCIEALRYNIIKTKSMPELDYDSLYRQGSNEIYKLKIYLIVLIFFLNMQKMALISSDFTLPELSVDKVKEKILFLHAQSNIGSLYKKYQKSGELTKLEKESLFGSISYLEYCAKNYKSEVVVDQNILKFGKENNFEYPCQSCDSTISEGERPPLELKLGQ